MSTRKTRRSLADVFEDPTEPVSPGANEKAPKTGPESTQKPEQGDPDLRSTPSGAKPAKGDSGDDEPPARTHTPTDTRQDPPPHARPNPDVQASPTPDASLTEDVHTLLAGLPRLGTPEYEARVAAMRTRTTVGPQLSKQARARLGGNLRAAAGKLVAAQRRAYEAAQEWEEVVAWAGAQGASHALVLMAAFAVGLTDEYVPAPTGIHPTENPPA